MNLASVAAVLWLAACYSVEQPRESAPTHPHPAAQAVPAQPTPAAPTAAEYTPPKVLYNPLYDPQIKEIFALAKKSEWEEAQYKADKLAKEATNDVAIQRLADWVAKQRQVQREQNLEDEIRNIDAQNNKAFNPTIGSLLTEKKDRGLPARKDIRDAVQKIENSRYIPESYGKTNYAKGPLFEFESAKGRMAQVLDKEVTIHLDNVTMEALLQHLTQSSGVNFVADKSLPALKQVLQVNLDKVKLGEFLRYLGRNYELQFQIGPELVWVVDAKDTKNLMEETRFYRLRKGFVMPAEFGTSEITRQKTLVSGKVQTITETEQFDKFVNDNAPPQPAIETAITNLFTGKYMIDYEHNLIVARGTPEQLEVLEQIIKEFDQPIQQVLIESRFITISKPAFLRLGALWETGRQVPGTRTPQDYTGLVNSQDIDNLGIGLQETFTNVLGRAGLSVTISALEQMGESQTLSAPRLTVLNNRPATISDGKVQYYYEEYQVQNTVGQYVTSSSWVPSGKPTKITAGAELNVLASISGDGQHILLALNPKINSDVQVQTYASLTSFDQSGNVQSKFDIKLPQYRTQELATRVVVNSGDTVVMGGVLERSRSTFVESVPILGDIPLLGALFRRRTEVDQPRYLLIFVTATILTDTGEFLIYNDEKASKD